MISAGVNMAPSTVDNRPFKGMNAIVTGSTRGLGRTVAKDLAQLGAGVFITGRTARDVASTIDTLESENLVVAGAPADLSNPAEAHRLAETAVAALGKVDMLINNAGMSIRGNFWDVSDSEFETQVNTNLRAPFILAQHVARNMMEHQTRGRIVNFGTIGARRCHRNALVYDSAKGGVEVMTRNMAYELAPFGISVNCVVPGAIPVRPGNDFDIDDHRDYLKFVPFGRFGLAADISAAVMYFCQSTSEFTTGQSLLVDGGHATYRPLDNLH